MLELIFLVKQVFVAEKGRSHTRGLNGTSLALTSIVLRLQLILSVISTDSKPR